MPGSETVHIEQEPHKLEKKEEEKKKRIKVRFSNLYRGIKCASLWCSGIYSYFWNQTNYSSPAYSEDTQLQCLFCLDLITYKNERVNTLCSITIMTFFILQPLLILGDLHHTAVSHLLGVFHRMRKWGVLCKSIYLL